MAADEAGWQSALTDVYLAFQRNSLLMLFLHCGWPKTGTTSLQNALYMRRQELREVGFINAPQWRVLPDRLNGPEPGAAIDEFMQFAADNAESDVLISCETFMLMLLTEKRQDLFIQLVEAVQEVVPVVCVWTLRRWDEMVRSYYLWQLMTGFEPPPFDDYLKPMGIRGMFPGLRRFDEHMGGASVYCKFELGGSHNEQLLRIFRVPDEISADIRREWRCAPRLNVPPSHKQVAALLNVEWLSRKRAIPRCCGRP